MTTWVPPLLTLDGPADVAWTVRWTNSEGIADSEGSVSVAQTGSTVPAAPASGAWRVEPTYDLGTQIWLAVDAVPTGATAIEWRKDGGAWTETDCVAPGVFLLSGFSGGAEATVDLRFVNASGDGFHATKTVTPRAKSNTQFACWGDGHKRHALTVEPTDAGSTAAMTENCNNPFEVVGRGEAEVLRWETSVYKRRWRYQASFSSSAWTVAVDPGDSIFFDPLGSARHLAPAETELRTIYTTIGATTIAVHGPAGMTTWGVNSRVGFNSAGLPSFFRFARKRQGGILPDRRPFVVGPVEIVHNGGDPITVTPDAAKGYALVSLNGAVLCVVARPGIIPPLGASAVALESLGYSAAYTRRRGVYDFAADGWDDTAANAASSTGLTLRETFESIGVYCALAAETTCKVRFRKQGDANWYPAHDLWFDKEIAVSGDATPRNFSGYPEAFMAAKHRGAIIWLEPGATYDVQIKQGTTYRKATATTWSHDVSRVSVELGHVVGNVTISKTGDLISVNRPGLPTLTADVSGGKWLDLHSGSVLGFINIAESVGSKVIIRDVDRFGGARTGIAEGINIPDGVFDVRVIGGRDSGLGAQETDGGNTIAGEGWFGGKNDCCVSVRARKNCHSVAVLGRLFGAPRFGANSWNEVRAELTSKGNNDPHPYGVQIFGKHISQKGRLVVSDCAAQADPFRAYGDVISGSGNNKPGKGATTAPFGRDQVADTGPDCVFAWNCLTDWLDDAVEIEGQATNCVHIANRYDAKELRLGTCVSSGVSHSWVASGPVMGAFNVFTYDSADGRAQNQVIFKARKEQAVKYTDSGSNWPQWARQLMGRRHCYNETVVNIGPRLMELSLSKVASPLLGWYGRNCLHQAAATHATTTTVSGYALNLRSSTYLSSAAAALPAALSLDADLFPTGSSLVGAGEWIFNVNDGGPFYRAAPNIGAR